MTKEQWQQVEKALSGTYGIAKLKVDGRDVTFQRSLISNNQLAIVTYVNGEWKGAWLQHSKPCPEQAYLRPISKPAWSKASRDRMKKLSKRMIKEMKIDPTEKYHGYSLYWNNATQIRRHYTKTFTSIELVETVG